MARDQSPDNEPQERRGRLISRVPTALSVTASLIAISGLGFAALKTLTANGSGASTTTEAKQIVSFRQLANSICAENQGALEKALPESHSGVQLLAFLSRGTGWGINDLEGVTAPASLATPFSEEIGVRRHIGQTLLELQRARETGDLIAKSEAVGALASSEESAATLDRELGLRRCAPVLPLNVKEAIDVK